MRIITLNLNGIRSACSKGLLRWLAKQKADVVCLQELRAREADFPDSFRRLRWHRHAVDAEKKGYSGVAVLTKRKPDAVVTGMGYQPFDAEGRFVRVDLGSVSFISVYVPSGSSGETRQRFKMDCLRRLRQHLQAILGEGREVIVCGDINIAHTRIDLENWRSNQKNSGFLPEEREWLDRLFADGWVDAFRAIPQVPQQYTWWSNRGRAWAKNVGWRLDYQICTPALGKQVTSTAIYKRKRFSDHAPLTIDYDFSL